MRSAKNVVIFWVGVGWYITQRCYFPPMCANSLAKRRISADFRRLAQILGIYFYMFFVLFLCEAQSTFVLCMITLNPFM